MGYKLNDGNYIDYTVAGSAVKAGDVVCFDTNKLAGVAIRSGEVGDVVSVALDGRWALTASSLTCTAGNPAYWDATNSKVIASVASGVTAPQIGVFAETKSSFTGNVAVIVGCAGITKTGT